MSHVFKDQSLLRVTMETDYVGIVSADVKKIYYEKPSGITGAWIAIASGTTLYYDIEDGDIDEVGTWSFQAYIEIGGLKGYGDVCTHYFDKPIKVLP